MYYVKKKYLGLFASETNGFKLQISEIEVRKRSKSLISSNYM